MRDWELEALDDGTVVESWTQDDMPADVERLVVLERVAVQVVDDRTVVVLVGGRTQDGDTTHVALVSSPAAVRHLGGMLQRTVGHRREEGGS